MKVLSPLMPTYTTIYLLLYSKLKPPVMLLVTAVLRSFRLQPNLDSSDGLAYTNVMRERDFCTISTAFACMLVCADLPRAVSDQACV